MSMYYILDTNILIDYPDIIPDSDAKSLVEPSIDFAGAHLVIPTAVVRELSNHKKEMNDRGVACRTVLRRLRMLTEGANSSLENAYILGASVPIRDGTQFLDILPIRKNFCSRLKYHPTDSDMDGQILLAAISTAFCIKAPEENTEAYNTPDSVILLTNDNGLAIRAHARGVKTSRFSYKLPSPYTGRRDLIVPKDMFEAFFIDRFLSREDFERYMPDEEPLAANEYIIMYPENDEWPQCFDPTTNRDHYFNHIGRYNAKCDVIEPLRNLSNFPTSIRNAGQAIYADALMDPDISAVICTGPAGSGKTYMATIYSYTDCLNGNYIGISVVPCRVQDDGVGYLPGDLDEKLDPNVQPIKNAIRNYLLTNDKDLKREYSNLKKFGTNNKKSKKAGCEDESEAELKPKKSLKSRLEEHADLIYNNWFGKPIPIAYARGRDFTGEIAFYDEFQDQNRSEAYTLLTRIGNDGKILVTGDIEQIHAPYLDKDNNGLTFARNLLRGNPEVAQVSFLPSEVIRHSLVKAIVEKEDI